VNTTAPAPGVAHRAAKAKLCLIDVRDLDGRRIRSATLAQAEQLVSTGVAIPIIGENGWKEVRLSFTLPPNSNRPLVGRTAASKANPKSTYHHNQRGCETWRKE